MTGERECSKRGEGSTVRPILSTMHPFLSAFVPGFVQTERLLILVEAFPNDLPAREKHLCIPDFVQETPGYTRFCPLLDL